MAGLTEQVVQVFEGTEDLDTLEDVASIEDPVDVVVTPTPITSPASTAVPVDIIEPDEDADPDPLEGLVGEDGKPTNKALDIIAEYRERGARLLNDLATDEDADRVIEIGPIVKRLVAAFPEDDNVFGDALMRGLVHQPAAAIKSALASGASALGFDGAAQELEASAARTRARISLPDMARDPEAGLVSVDTLGEGLGQAVPSAVGLLMAPFTGGLTAGLAVGGFYGTLGFGVGKERVRQHRDAQGLVRDEELENISGAAYAVVEAASEVGGNIILSRVTRSGLMNLGRKLQKETSALEFALKGGARAIPKGAVEEGFEEGLSQVGQNIIDVRTGVEDEDMAVLFNTNVLEAMGQGALVGGFIGPVGTFANVIDSQKKARIFDKQFGGEYTDASGEDVTIRFSPSFASDDTHAIRELAYTVRDDSDIIVDSGVVNVDDFMGGLDDKGYRPKDMTFVTLDVKDLQDKAKFEKIKSQLADASGPVVFSLTRGQRMEAWGYGLRDLEALFNFEQESKAESTEATDEEVVQARLDEIDSQIQTLQRSFEGAEIPEAEPGRVQDEFDSVMGELEAERRELQSLLLGEPVESRDGEPTPEEQAVVEELLTPIQEETDGVAVEEESQLNETTPAQEPPAKLRGGPRLTDETATPREPVVRDGQEDQPTAQSIKEAADRIRELQARRAQATKKAEKAAVPETEEESPTFAITDEDLVRLKELNVVLDDDSDTPLFEAEDGKIYAVRSIGDDESITMSRVRKGELLKGRKTFSPSEARSMRQRYLSPKEERESPSTPLGPNLNEADKETIRQMVEAKTPIEFDAVKHGRNVLSGDYVLTGERRGGKVRVLPANSRSTRGRWVPYEVVRQSYNASIGFTEEESQSIIESSSVGDDPIVEEGRSEQEDTTTERAPTALTPAEAPVELFIFKRGGETRGRYISRVAARLRGDDETGVHVRISRGSATPEQLSRYGITSGAFILLPTANGSVRSARLAIDEQGRVSAGNDIPITQVDALVGLYHYQDELAQDEDVDAARMVNDLRTSFPQLFGKPDEVLDPSDNEVVESDPVAPVSAEEIESGVVGSATEEASIVADPEPVDGEAVPADIDEPGELTIVNDVPPTTGTKRKVLGSESQAEPESAVEDSSLDLPVSTGSQGPSATVLSPEEMGILMGIPEQTDEEGVVDSPGPETIGNEAPAYQDELNNAQVFGGTRVIGDPDGDTSAAIARLEEEQPGVLEAFGNVIQEMQAELRRITGNEEAEIIMSIGPEPSAIPSAHPINPFLFDSLKVGEDTLVLTPRQKALHLHQTFVHSVIQGMQGHEDKSLAYREVVANNALESTRTELLDKLTQIYEGNDLSGISSATEAARASRNGSGGRLAATARKRSGNRKRSGGDTKAPGKPKKGKPGHSRDKSRTRGKNVDAVKRVVRALRDRIQLDAGDVPIMVLHSARDLPSSIRAVIDDKDLDTITGMTRGSQVYLFADTIEATRSDPRKVLLHELKGHIGLGYLEDAKVEDLWGRLSHNKQLRTVARSRGYDVKTIDGRRRAIHEYIAMSAEGLTNDPGLGWRHRAEMRRAVATLFPGLRVSDAEIHLLLEEGGLPIPDNEIYYSVGDPASYAPVDLVDEIADVAGKSEDEQLSWLRHKMTAFTGKRGVRSVNEVRRQFMSSAYRRMRKLEERAIFRKDHEAAKALRQVRSLLFSGPQDRGQGTTFQEARVKAAQPFLMRLEKILGKIAASEDQGRAGIVGRLAGEQANPEVVSNIISLVRRGNESDEHAIAIRELMNDLTDYLVSKGVLSRNQLIDNYFPRLYDRDKVIDNEDRFKESVVTGLMAKHGGSGLNAQEAAGIANAAFQTLATGSDEAMERIALRSPLARKAYAAGPKGTPWFLKERLLDIDDAYIEDFLDNNAARVLTQYITRSVSFAEFFDRIEINERGEYPILAELRKAGVIEADLRFLSNVFDAHRGVYGLESSQSFRRAGRFIENMTALATLSLAGVASMAEFGTPILRMGASGAKGIAQAVGEAIGGNGASRQLGDEIGVTLSTAIESYLQEFVFGHDMAMSNRMSRVMSMFYRINGLEAITRMQRHMATAGARFLVRDLLSTHAPSKRQQREIERLGLPTQHIERSAMLRWLDALEGRTGPSRQAYKEGANADMWDRYSTAILRLVEQTIVQGNASNKPLYGSSRNPFARLAFQLQSFTFAFREGPLAFFNDELERGNLLILLQALPFLVFQYVVTELRRTLQFSSTPEDRSLLRQIKREETGVTRFRDLVMDSGFAGPTARLYHATQASKYGVDAMAYLGGPSLVRIGDFALGTFDMMQGKHERMSRTVARQVPFFGQIRPVRDGIQDGVEEALEPVAGFMGEVLGPLVE